MKAGPEPAFSCPNAVHPRKAYHCLGEKRAALAARATVPESH
jgi:hypothetical protein